MTWPSIPAGVLEWATPDWLAAGVVGLGIVIWALGLLPFHPGRGWGSRGLEAALTAVALAGLVWMLLGPQWVEEGDRTEEGRMVVLVDGSRSMGVLEPDGRPRSAAVAELLERIGPAEVYTFGDRLRSGAPAVYTDGDSDLGGALDAVARKYAGERLGGVVVISDGIDRGGLRRRLSAGEAPKAPPGPVTIYQVGTPAGRTDLAVDDVRAGSFAFLRANFPVDVEVRGIGAVPPRVTVALTRDGQPAGTAVAVLGADGRGTAHFSVKPDRAGRFLYEASVPLVAGDAVPANQQMGLAVSVVRDRVRVLQVCGSPSWDQKFLRLFLKEDQAIDLVSFFILRTNRDMNSGYSEHELSLIKFPYQNLFDIDRELSTFDLVIFQNFDYAPYFEQRAAELLGNVAEYVKRGGAFVMLGGDRSFDLGQYAGTPIADILPVTLGSPLGADERPVVPRLTPAGARHPVTQLTGSAADNPVAWSELAPMDGVNIVAGAAAGAAVLLEHPDVRGADGRPMPILAVREVGKGRTMALTSDASWRWSFAEAGTGRGNQAYLKFWKGAMRWLIGDPAGAPVTVETARENYAPEEEATALVRVRDVTFAARDGVQVSAQVSGPEGGETRTAVTDANGEARIALPTALRGPHRVTVRAQGMGAGGEAQTVYGVSTRDPELDEVEPDPDFLQALARAWGGAWVGPGDFAAPTRDPTAGQHVRDRRVTPLGTHPAVGALVAVAASLGWLVRRRAGLR